MSLRTIDVPSGFLGESGVWGAAIPNGPFSISFPLASQGCYARVYQQPYIVHTGADVPGATGAPGIFANTVLAEETDRVPLGGGFVEFGRVFAEIPSGFNDWETCTYTFPSLAGGLRAFQKVETVTARVWHDFHLTANPQTITLSGATRFLNSYGWDVTELNYGAATTPNIPTYSGWVGSGVELIAQPATITRYLGPIWLRTTPYVKAL